MEASVTATMSEIGAESATGIMLVVIEVGSATGIMPATEAISGTAVASQIAAGPEWTTVLRLAARGIPETGAV